MTEEDVEEEQLDQPFSDDGAILRSRVTQLESMFGDTRAELIGVLNSGVKYGRSVKENVVFISEQQSGIQNAVKMMFKPKVPWNMVMLLGVVLGVIALFAIRPEYGREFGIAIGIQQNQLFIFALAIVALLMIFILARRRRKQP